jgi:hypothetical protein
MANDGVAWVERALTILDVFGAGDRRICLRRGDSTRAAPEPTRANVTVRGRYNSLQIRCCGSGKGTLVMTARTQGFGPGGNTGL